MGRRRSWLFPALLALLLFVGELAANFMPVNIPPGYQPWMWAVIVLAAIAAVALAVWDARQSSAAPNPTPPEQTTLSGDFDGPVAAGSGDAVDASAAAGPIIKPSGPVTQHFYAIYQQPAGPARLGAEQFQPLLEEYLGWVERAYARARLYGLESLRTARGRPVRSLADVFVPITLRRFTPPSRQAVEELAQELGADALAERKAFLALADERRQSGEPLAVAELLTTHNRLAVIGGAGCGKSTLLTYLTFCLAHHAQSGAALPFRLPSGRSTPIPLLIPLRYYRQYQEACRNAAARSLDHPRSGTLAGFIPWYLKQRSPALELSEDFFDRLLLGGGCLLLLDGLDEIVDQRERGQVRAQVEALANHIYPANRFIVTAREAGYRENAVFGDDFVRLDVQPLDEEQTRALVGNWCEQIYPGEVESQSEAIVTAIATINQRYRSQNLPPLIDTPLMTTMVISVKWGETELPRERSKLYEAAVKVILQAQYLDEDESRETLINWGGPWEEQREWLSHLALAMHSRGQAGAALDEAALRTILRERLTPEKLDAFVRAVRLRGGLLEERAELFQFIHLTFQEFLSARLLAKERSDAWPRLLPHLADGWWREVFLLHYGFAKSDFDRYAQEFLNWLSDLPAVDDATRLAGLELAAAALLEIERPEPEVRRRLAKRLAAALTDPTWRTTPEQRLAAGKTLSQLGDSRPGVGLRPDGLPDIAWVKIAETDSQGRREFIYGEGERRSEPTFWMARYPITYAQFQAFVDASDGLANPRWWDGLARRDNDDLLEQRFPFRNHPQDTVSWYQAIAFCRWLTEQTRQNPSLLPADLPAGLWRISLPTEWQWEKTARGYDGRKYPWGPRYLSGYANVDETEKQDGPHYLQSSSAVGLYPQGASPYGLLDMSGNVWEWCLNEYEKPERIQTEGDEWRVVRGGNYFLSAASASASSRDGYYPWYGGDDWGFRCVVVPLSHG
ncbi:MAG: SUMF1/EgtB/PvdO family nonheme iron enzyme [Chloroflexi bacterium]|nr:SUMF1/EgtB/PvdO family nonheme iron enzyme [Chloroflexota bacterium]